MSTFSCPVVKIASVENHSGADRLSIVKLEGLGFTCISGKLEDGSPRYKVGDFVVYIPSAAVLPEWLLKAMDFWDDINNKGTLAGSDGNRVKPLKLRGIFSEGVLYPVKFDAGLSHFETGTYIELDPAENDEYGPNWLTNVFVGLDVAESLGITKWEPPIPTNFAGEVANLSDYTCRYDFEKIEAVLDMFTPGEQVIASEKLHGTAMFIVFVPGLNHPEMFGSQGEFIIHSKGLGAQGLAFKNNDANKNNIYVRTLKKLLDAGLENRLKESLGLDSIRSITLIGEVFGRGIQDLHYGQDTPGFRVFDIKVDHAFEKYFLRQTEVKDLLAKLDIDMVPTVYNGPFDLAELEKVRGGNTVLGGNNIREGIVVRSVDEVHHPIYGRKIFKMISETYLLRKNKDATEFT